MKLCISNLGLDPKRPEEPGPCLEGTLRLVNDNSLFEQQARLCPGPKTSLNLILLDPITASDIARIANNDEHLVTARICNNIFSEKVVPRNTILKILKLTNMEMVVLSLMSENYTNDQIADALRVDKETPKSHGYNIKKKTGLHTKLQLTQAFTAFKVLYPDWRCGLKEALRKYCP